MVIRGKLRDGLGARYAGEVESALAGENANPVCGQISSPTERISSRALLFLTTPGRMM